MSIPSSYANGSIGGGNSPSGDVKFTYLGFQQSKNSDNLITKVTYQGTKQKLQYERDRENSPWAIGSWRDDYGRLQSVDIQQEAGPFWHATVSFNKPLSLGISVSIGNGSPQESSLDISMASLPLEKAYLYDYRWNHALIATTSAATGSTAGNQHTAPAGFPQLAALVGSLGYTFDQRWTQGMAYNIYNAGKGGKFAASLDLQWLDDPSVTPDRGLVDWSEQNANNKPAPKNYPWRVAYYPQKPGVEHWQFPVYTITESGKYNSRLSCAWAIKRGGTIAYPSMGDYGIQLYAHPNLKTATTSDTPSGYWLCQGGTVNYDGKYYYASCKYTYSPDPKGWDQQLYGFFEGWSTYLNDSKSNPHPVITNSGVSNPILP